MLAISNTPGQTEVNRMLNTIGERQKQLLKLLRGTKPGMSVDELSKGLEITRNAVRQHLSSLEGAGLVTAGMTRPSGGGRPQQLYVLTELGQESFPRKYSWLAQLVLASVQREEGAENMGKRLSDIGAGIDRKSTRLNSSHLVISYAVFCLKKKKTNNTAQE